MYLIVNLQVAYSTVGMSVVDVVINCRKRVGSCHGIRHTCAEPVPVTVGNGSLVDVAFSIRKIDRLGRIE